MSKSFSEKVAEAKAAVAAVSARQANELLGHGRVAFVDPRPADAIRATTGMIPGAWNIPLEDIASGNLPPELVDKATRVITSCQAGPMGAVAAHELVKQGFGDVSYIDGGTQGWLDAGFATER